MKEYTIRVAKAGMLEGSSLPHMGGTAASQEALALPREKEEIQLKVLDMETWEWLDVKAIVSRSFQDMPGADKLWLYDWWGGEDLVEEEPWAIKILEVMEEPPEEVKVSPKKEVGLGRMRGSMLETLIRRQQEGEGEDT
jgi:hypothetical protein